MVALMKLAIREAYAILFALAAIVAWRLCTGKISTRGLIEGRTRGGGSYLSASRVQLLLATLAMAVQYVNQARLNPHALPDIPQNWLMLLGASHILYLGNKFQGKRKGNFHI